MTNTSPRSTALLLAVAALALALGATGGAVAGAMVTGAQIKNGTVTGKDIKDRSLKVKDLSAKTRARLKGDPGAQGLAGPTGSNGTNGTNGSNGTNGVSGYQTSTDTDTISSGGDGTASESCTSGRTLIGAFGYLSVSVHPVMVIWDDSDTASAFTDNVPAANTLTLRIVCADLS